MPRKELKLMVADLGFYLTGRADVRKADYENDEWLWPLDFEYQLQRSRHYFEPLDENGIPVRVLPGTGRRTYLFSRAIGYALTHWNKWRRSGDERSLQIFLRVCDWLVSIPDGRYEHDIEIPGMPDLWISCISQGEALSALSRAFLVSERPTYLKAAQDAARWLNRPVGRDGLIDTLPDGQPFLEEYPGSPYRHVLNGCLYAMIGLHDLSRVSSPGNSHRKLFDELVEAISANIEAWDVDGWTRYDYPVVPAQAVNLNTMTYQILMASQVSYVAHVSGNKRLGIFADRWFASAGRLSMPLRALIGKIFYRLRARW